MKQLPGLPRLPKGHFWRVRATSFDNSLHVEIMKHPDRKGSLIGPYAVERDRTRSWPQPTARSVVRVANRLHRKFLHSRATHPLEGSYR
jgi:hypothetical protein